MQERNGQPQDQPTPAPRDVYTYADAVAHCPTHRAQHEAAEASYAEFHAANAASMARRDRQQLGLRIALPRPAQAQ
ncbi:hypothetical protein OG342_04985 [Streptomyces bobili]|uniref:hypothetical protein n=1 Tax=Streptomyces bobili TaxID=67280 RepID=UPI002254190B|nr:hypothetical protein [Streptomyces bobili]MCX5522223.1 hypothetical protein [Streptomyces bobili]